MKEVGIFTLISVAAIAAAPTPAEKHPTHFTTVKSTDQFAACFAETQEQHSRPWWFVPRDSGGGTFSNRGAASVSKPYLLVIADRGARREIQLQDADVNGVEARGVEQCI